MQNTRKKSYSNKTQDEEARKKVIEASVPLFNQLGCKGVTMDILASTLHISKRTLYEMFVNKESLLLECISEVHRQLWKKRIEIMNKASEPFLMALFITRNETKISLRYSRILKDGEQYYPDLTLNIIKKFTERFKETLFNIFNKAKEDGDLRNDINVKDIVDVIAINVRICSINSSLDNELQTKLILESLYTYLRGTLSISAIERYDKNEEEYKRLLEIYG